MHSSLWLLLRLDFQGSLRSFGKILRSWKRFGLLIVILLLLGGMIFARSLQPDQVGSSRFGAGMPFWAFIYLAASWLAASGDRGLVMRPAEIHFLFGGPFRSREIITLHLVRLCIRSFISALVLCLVAAIYIPSFPCGLVGLWLLLAVSLLVGMSVSLMARSIHGTGPRIVRRLLTVVVVALTLLMIAQSVGLLRQRALSPEISLIAATAPETSIGQYILPALQWMFKPLSTSSFLTECLPLLPLRLFIVSILVLSVYLLGGNFSEASAMRTDQAMARRQTALRGGSTAGTGSYARRISIPLPSLRMGGIAAVSWWQVVHLMRILPRYLAFTAVVLGLLIVIPAMVDSQSFSGIAGVFWLWGLSLYADFLLLLQLPVGFMVPASQRELLKTLPIPNWRIVIGQLMGASVPILFIHSITATLFALVFPIPWPYWICTVIALIPAAMVIVSTINLLGIWGIIQPRALQQRDVLAAGRAMVSVWLFAILMIPASIIAVVFGLLAEVLAASLLPENCGLILGCGLGCIFSACINVALISWTFARWQPSTGERGDLEKEYDH